LLVVVQVQLRLLALLAVQAALQPQPRESTQQYLILVRLPQERQELVMQVAVETLEATLVVLVYQLVVVVEMLLLRVQSIQVQVVKVLLLVVAVQQEHQE